MNRGEKKQYDFFGQAAPGDGLSDKQGKRFIHH